MEDGSFTLLDVRSADYLLPLFIYPRKNNSVDVQTNLAAVSYPFTVPPGQGLEPLDVGLLQPMSMVAPNAGQATPDIVFPTIEGTDVQLSQFKGKTVLLDFWGTWCGVCLGDLPEIKAIYQSHSNDPNFVMISLSAGDTPEKWRKFVQENGMTWTQGILGPDAENVWQGKLYCVTGYPSYWLIGPDGRVIAEGFQMKEMRPYIEKALAGTGK